MIFDSLVQSQRRPAETHDWVSYDETNVCTSYENTFITFTFQSGQTKVIPGIESRDGAISDKDTIGSFALVPQKYNDQYWVDGTYNNQDYKVYEGTVKSSAGDYLNAYKINPATIQTKEGFVATEHLIYYKFPNYETHNIYMFNETS